MENQGNGERTESRFDELIDGISDADVIVYEYLNASNDKEAKAEFLENENLTHPRNEYGNLDVEKVKENLVNLKRIADESENAWLDEKSYRLVNSLANENIRKNEFLLANYLYQVASSPEEKEAAKAYHKETNEALYGAPDEETFYSILRDELKSIYPENPEEEVDYLILKSKIGEIPETSGERFKPKPETFEKFSKIVRDYYADFLKHIPSDKKSLSSEEMVSIVNEILDEEIDDDTVFKAIIDDKSANASVNQEEQIIKFPPDKTYSIKRARELICHEIGTHMLRAIPYLEGDVDAFSEGAPGNTTYDEGVAKCVEQAISGKYEDAGAEHYINIGLATFKGKNFREVYDILTLLEKLKHEDDVDTLNLVQRCFRGTGELPNNKDLAYYKGANKIWQYVEEHIDDPKLMDTLLLSGKTVATNHIR